MDVKACERELQCEVRNSLTGDLVCHFAARRDMAALEIREVISAYASIPVQLQQLVFGQDRLDLMDACALPLVDVQEGKVTICSTRQTLQSLLREDEYYAPQFGSALEALASMAPQAAVPYVGELLALQVYRMRFDRLLDPLAVKWRGRRFRTFFFETCRHDVLCILDNLRVEVAAFLRARRSTNYRRCGPPYTMRAFTKASKIMNDRKRRANREETGSKSDQSE